MNKKRFNGKAIYTPSGKAGEYSYWACNLHVGCSNGCEYCYCKKGILAPVMGQNMPVLKTSLKTDGNAFTVFKKELEANLEDLRKHGLFFSFTTDPLLPETRMLSTACATTAVTNGVPVKFLTKCACADFLLNWTALTGIDRKMVAVGFTLTGHDELEPNASTNAERIEAMRQLHEAGFHTFASIEPVIDFDSSLAMIHQAEDCCELFKIGLESGKAFDADETARFMGRVSTIVNYHGRSKVYFKDGLLRTAKMERNLVSLECGVGRDYNLFQNENGK